jgi:hypothetical protein
VEEAAGGEAYPWCGVFHTLFQGRTLPCAVRLKTQIDSCAPTPHAGWVPARETHWAPEREPCWVLQCRPGGEGEAC